MFFRSIVGRHFLAGASTGDGERLSRTSQTTDYNITFSLSFVFVQISNIYEKKFSDYFTYSIPNSFYCPPRRKMPSRVRSGGVPRFLLVGMIDITHQQVVWSTKQHLHVNHIEKVLVFCSPIKWLKRFAKSHYTETSFKSYFGFLVPYLLLVYNHLNIFWAS